VANCIPEPNLCRLLVGLRVEREAVWLAAEGHRLVYRCHSSFLYRHRPSGRIRSEDEVVGESHTPSRSCDRGLNMEITGITIRLSNEHSVRAYVDIVFGQLFYGRRNQSHPRPHGIFRFLSRQDEERRQRPAACVSGQCGKPNHVEYEKSLAKGNRKATTQLYVSN